MLGLVPGACNPESGIHMEKFDQGIIGLQLSKDVALSALEV